LISYFYPTCPSRLKIKLECVFKAFKVRVCISYPPRQHDTTRAEFQIDWRISEKRCVREEVNIEKKKFSLSYFMLVFLTSELKMEASSHFTNITVL